ncbi:MAG: sugar transferase [Lachnospiraceae bacterium]|nr:sugar transferase [Lachnospiraceae bacterium]HAD55526.1 sugar transferase [Lachnospiraceae bacterium]
MNKHDLHQNPSTYFERTKMTRDMRWQVADWLADERLPELNHNSKIVKTSSGIYLRCVKRILDICISLIALIVTLPLNAIIAIITLVDVGTPLLFRQKRTGFHGKEFEIIKFRNMKDTRDERGELLPAKDRVTRWGKFVRKTSLDELLNFWSVLKGDMSLIGPRPLPTEYFHRYTNRHACRLNVRPGLECPPRKLEGHRPSWQEQFENDVWYVEHVSFKTDLQMLIQLFKYVFDRKSAWARAEVNEKGIFMGYDEAGIAINLEQVPEEYIERAFKEMINTRKGD